MSKRHVCLVRQNVNFPFVFEAAEKYNFDLTLLHRPGENPKDLPAVIRSAPLDLSDEKLAFEKVLSLHRERPFDGIVSLWEGALAFVSRSAAKLGLRAFPEKAALITRDKGRMREVMKAAGCNVPWFRRISTVAQLADLGNVPFPVVVKPAHGFGSAGVIRADSPDELRDAVRRVEKVNAERLADFCEGKDDILIESYLEGREFVAETYANEGTVHVVSIAYKGHPTGPFFAETILVAQADISTELERMIKEEVSRATLAVGVTQGPTHSELRLDRNGRPCVIDIGARVGGFGASAPPAYHSVGVDLLKVLLDDVTGKLDPAVLDKIPAPKGVGTWFNIPVGNGGVFDGIDGQEEVLAHQDTIRILPLTVRGETLTGYPDFKGYSGILFSKHSDYTAAMRYLDDVASKLKSRYR